MFQQYVRQSTQEVHQVLENAINELASSRQSILTPDHLLLGLLAQKDSEAISALKNLLGHDPSILNTLMSNIYDNREILESPRDQERRSIVATSEVEAVFKTSLKEAQQMGDVYIGTGTLLLGLVDPSSGKTAQYFTDLNLSPEQIREQLIQQRQGRTLNEVDDETKTDTLKEYTLDLTELARNQQLDPVIGREEEIGRIIQTLSRRKKNNPVLIGQPGVGKTVIVEGLAQLIADAKVPETLRGKRVLSMDMAEIIAGAKMRGEFEERLKGIRDAVINAKGQIILFIDELHTVVGAGAGGGGIDAPALLKSALAKGSLQVIGADTLVEYHRYVESDKALERRFQPILVKEPSIESSINILKGLAPKYENHHEIHYDTKALEAAVKLSERYISDRLLPDKAVDLMDESGARKHLRLLAMSDPISTMERKRQTLIADKDKAFSSQKFEEVADLQMQLLALEKDILSEQESQSSEHSHLDRTVTEDDIAEVVARLTGIPASKLAETESNKLANMESKIHQRIIGQHQAISAIANAIRRNRTGINSSHRPIGSFLFLGPTGVGKTELAKALAEFLLDDESRIIRIDMSEYMERHEVSKMIGAPPGYIGYGEGGQLTESVRRNPYSVILLDEIEKAHPDVFNVLLQILEDGRLTDAQGQVVSFKNTLLIGTSNLGSDNLISDRNPVGFIYSEEPDYEAAQKTVLMEVKKFFKPEFLNRLDDVVVFHYLDQENVQAIAEKLIADLIDQIYQQDITLTVTPEVIEKLATDGFNPVYGARPLRREVEKQLENPIAAMIVENRCPAGCNLKAFIKKGELTIEVKQSNKGKH